MGIDWGAISVMAVGLLNYMASRDRRRLTVMTDEISILKEAVRKCEERHLAAQKPPEQSAT